MEHVDALRQTAIVYNTINKAWTANFVIFRFTTVENEVLFFESTNKDVKRKVEILRKKDNIRIKLKVEKK